MTRLTEMTKMTQMTKPKMPSKVLGKPLYEEQPREIDLKTFLIDATRLPSDDPINLRLMQMADWRISRIRAGTTIHRQDAAAAMIRFIMSCRGFKACGFGPTYDLFLSRALKFE